MQIIRNFLSDNHITETTFAIGVSGGADSLALALMFKEEFPQYRLIALTVDHKLRPTSSTEALYVADIMKRHGIEHHTLVWQGEKPLTGIEEQARIARYQLMCDWCKDNNVHYIAIAHHLYDQAETFLMRLQRGSGLYGLSAMCGISERNGIKIIRPFLNTHPDKLKTYLSAKNIEWVEDESNQCVDFLRVKMRKFLPQLEKNTTITSSRLAETASNLRRVRNFIEDTVSSIILSKVHNWSNCGYSFDYTEFLDWHKELRFYVLAKLLTNLGELVYTPEANSLNTLIEKLLQKDFLCFTLGNCYILKENLKLWIIKENRKYPTDYSIEQWRNYELEFPEVRGLKIPYKLKIALLFEKLSKKI